MPPPVETAHRYNVFYLAVRMSVTKLVNKIITHWICPSVLSVANKKREFLKKQAIYSYCLY